MPGTIESEKQDGNKIRRFLNFHISNVLWNNAKPDLEWFQIPQNKVQGWRKKWYKSCLPTSSPTSSNRIPNTDVIVFDICWFVKKNVEQANSRLFFCVSDCSYFLFYFFLWLFKCFASIIDVFQEKGNCIKLQKIFAVWSKGCKIYGKRAAFIYCLEMKIIFSRCNAQINNDFSKANINQFLWM